MSDELLIPFLNFFFFVYWGAKKKHRTLSRSAVHVLLIVNQTYFLKGIPSDDDIAVVSFILVIDIPRCTILMIIGRSFQGVMDIICVIMILSFKLSHKFFKL